MPGRVTRIPDSAGRSIRVPLGHCAIVGYGSLLLRSSLEESLGRRYAGTWLACSVSGWRRAWDAAMTNESVLIKGTQEPVWPEAVVYLNVRRDPPTRMNGMLFVIGPSDVAVLDERESIYDRVDVSGDLDVGVENGPVYLYVCRPDHLLANVESARKAVVRASYLRTVDHALSQAGVSFRKQYDASTDSVPAHLVVDDIDED